MRRLYGEGRQSSEVLLLQWRHIDFVGNEIRLDADTTNVPAPSAASKVQSR
jgi:hypothetical protein